MRRGGGKVAMTARSRPLSASERLSPLQVASRLKIHRVTLYGWIKRGCAPPSYKLGARRWFDEDELERWLRKQRRGGAA